MFSKPQYIKRYSFPILQLLCSILFLGRSISYANIMAFVLKKNPLNKHKCIKWLTGIITTGLQFTILLDERLTFDDNVSLNRLSLILAINYFHFKAKFDTTYNQSCIVENNKTNIKTNKPKKNTAMQWIGTSICCFA